MTYFSLVGVSAVISGILLGTGPVVAQQSGINTMSGQVRSGTAAYGDWRTDAPGVIRKITSADLPAPFNRYVVGNPPDIAAWPAAGLPRVPEGFAVGRFVTGLTNPRIVRVAPNGDVFVAESAAGRIRVMQTADGAAQPQRTGIFVRGLDRPFGLAFYPPGPDPQWLYVATNNSVQKFPYRNGDQTARGNAQIVVSRISETSGYHWTRDVAFSQDGKLMYVSVGSGSNNAEGIGRLAPAAIKAHEAQYGVGAAWGRETLRADVLVFDPEGGNRRVFATGLRNCVGLAVQPQTENVWCSTNERDGMGDNLPPDYVTRVRQGGFYGWPWFYIGNHQDPSHIGERPDLAERVDVPDVLIQPHSAPLGMVFYQGAGVAAFPSEYRGDAFVALHGSWNRESRTGYKVVRVRLRNGVPDGTYQDFMTGFVANDEDVWGRLVGVAVAHDGALFVTDDGAGTIWRVASGVRRGAN